MNVTMKTGGVREPDQTSWTDLQSLERLEHIALKGVQDHDALTHVEILEMCKLVLSLPKSLARAGQGREAERWQEIEVGLERLSQELGPEYFWPSGRVDADAHRR